MSEPSRTNYHGQGLYDRRIGAVRPSMARNTLLVPDPIGRKKIVRPPPPNPIFRPWPPAAKRHIKEWHVPDLMYWRKFKSSHHIEQCRVDFITLGQAALDERKVTASEWQKFYKDHRDIAKKIVCWDNCKDIDPITGVKRIRKTIYPEIPDPPLLDEFSSVTVNMLYHNQYCRAWLLGEHARVDHENTLKRAHDHMEINRVVNRDQRRLENQNRFIARREARKGLGARPLAHITPPRRVCAQTGALDTFQSEGKRCAAYRQDAIKKAVNNGEKRISPTYLM